MKCCVVLHNKHDFIFMSAKKNRFNKFKQVNIKPDFKKKKSETN